MLCQQVSYNLTETSPIILRKQKFNAATSMSFKMFFCMLVVLFAVIESLDSICHKQCVCMKRVRLLQCTDLDSVDYSTLRGSMAWITSAVFITSIIDTDLLVAYVLNLKGIKLHNCFIVTCNLNGCPNPNLPAGESPTPTTNYRDIPSKDVKSSSSKSDISLKVTTAFFDVFKWNAWTVNLVKPKSVRICISTFSWNCLSSLYHYYCRELLHELQILP